jgi:hypothetical protein
MLRGKLQFMVLIYFIVFIELDHVLQSCQFRNHGKFDQNYYFLSRSWNTESMAHTSQL